MSARSSSPTFTFMYTTYTEYSAAPMRAAKSPRIGCAGSPGAGEPSGNVGGTASCAADKDESECVTSTTPMKLAISTIPHVLKLYWTHLAMAAKTLSREKASTPYTRPSARQKKPNISFNFVTHVARHTARRAQDRHARNAGPCQRDVERPVREKPEQRPPARNARRLRHAQLRQRIGVDVDIHVRCVLWRDLVLQRYPRRGW